MEENLIVDICVIGGGINGVGVAVDAAGRGLSVALCEQADLANFTSSSSSKLIHGGLRYLEYFEFRLVREALSEREVLLKKAPHIIWPLEFVMPHHSHLRPAWMIRLGLFLYDYLGKRRVLPRSHRISLKQHIAGKPLAQATQGFTYADCWVDDARLVVLNAMQAQQKGAKIFTRTVVSRAYREGNFWQIETRDLHTGQIHHLQARALINAAGPWVGQLLEDFALPSKNQITLVKGSHIVVPKLFDHAYAYILQNTDKRIVFAIPYLGHFTLIGTTDVALSPGEPPEKATISAAEVDYLCEVINRYFNKKITAHSVVWSYSGVRPLHSDGSQNPSAITRDYTLECQVEENGLPILSIFGGKITTYRQLAEHALEILKPFFPNMGEPWTAETPLPGGDMKDANFEAFYAELQRRYPGLPTELIYRYARSYGTLTYVLLADATCLSDLGACLGADLYEREVAYLMREEWACTAEDILWRRTKLGLFFTQRERENLEKKCLHMG